MNFDDIFQTIGGLLGVEDGPITVQDLREMLDDFAALLNNNLPEVGGFDAAIPYKEVDGRALTLDVIVPKGKGPFPVLVYLHGGAWIWGSPTTHRKLTYRLAEQGFLTMSVDYRLAPEHPFPAGFNDCVHAIHFAANNAHRWDGDRKKLVAAGGSAGGNLAAAAAIELANTVDAPMIQAVALLYGVFDFSDFGSVGITRLLADAYLDGQNHLVDDARVSPLVSAARLPPAYIAVGSADPLIEDSGALRSVLAKAGKPHDYHVYEDMPHAFMQMEFLPGVQSSIKNMTDFLHDTLDHNIMG